MDLQEKAEDQKTWHELVDAVLGEIKGRWMMWELVSLNANNLDKDNHTNYVQFYSCITKYICFNNSKNKCYIVGVCTVA